MLILLCYYTTFYLKVLYVGHTQGSFDGTTCYTLGCRLFYCFVKTTKPNTSRNHPKEPMFPKKFQKCLKRFFALKKANDTSSTEHSNLSGYQHKIDVDFNNNEITESQKNAHYVFKPLNRTLTNYFERDETNRTNYYHCIVTGKQIGRAHV